MVAPEREHAKAAEQVQITLAGRVEQIRSLGTHVVDIEAEGAQHAQRLRIEMPLEQRELLGLALVQEACRSKLTDHLHMPVRRTGWGGTISNEWVQRLNSKSLIVRTRVAAYQATDGKPAQRMTS